METSPETIVLVTGTNSGLGFAICCRAIDEFLTTQKKNRRDDTTLTLIFTTRSQQKSNETERRLRAHTITSAQKHGIDHTRVTLYPEQVNLSDLRTVKSLATRLTTSPRIPKLDALILNAGVSGFSGISWWRAIWTSLTNMVQAMTWPTYMRSLAGQLNAKQTARGDEPVLGHVFCANVFGHYMLGHYLMPLLSVRPETDASRVIWVSSIEACIHDFDVEDVQGLKVARSYQSSKYLTDVLALTSELPNTRPWVERYMSTSRGGEGEKRRSTPAMYTCHPGICATSIVPLPRVLYYCMVLAFYICRLLGSPWHVVSAYGGAFAPVFLAMSSAEKLDEAESPYRRRTVDGAVRGRVKWGSACTRFGREELACTEVEGWGFGGVIGGPPRECVEDRLRWRKHGARDLTEEDKVRFVEMGRRCWGEMEGLREKWEELLESEDGEGKEKEKGRVEVKAVEAQN